MKLSRTGILIVVGILLVVLIVFAKYQVDLSAWGRVEEGLIRLESGLRYEAILQLRSKLADADANIGYYKSRTRLFPFNHGARIDNASKAVSYLGVAIDWDTNALSEKPAVDIATLQSLDASYDIATFVPRSCVTGAAVASRESIAGAFLAKGTFFLDTALGSSDTSAFPAIGKNPVLSVESETQQCQQEYAALLKRQQQIKEELNEAEQRKYWSHISVSRGTPRTG